ncbi:uncharacterized protein LOC134238277 isoform X2 [Saccostrea cucullata]|uniref:uncharacterized protein LOC134238277 isoform X2 n=1 Tax=Saccostrea cuccullata TaxID=36930 RepID=UPI002ED537BC
MKCENLVTCESTIQRTDYKTGEVTVCGRINCTAGSYVKVCTKNGTDDHCERCPSGTHLLDNTSSDLPTPCVTGTAIIPPPQPKSSLITTRAPTVRSTPQRTGPGRDTVTMVTLTTDSPTNTSDYQKHTSDSPTDTSDFPKHTSDSGTTTQIAIYVAIGVGVVALVVAVVVLVVICYRKRRSRPNNVPNENQMEMEPLNNTPVSTESCNRNDKTEESSAELIPNGTPQCTVGSQTTDRIMGTGERSLHNQSTQNGYINNINSPSSEEIPPQETNIKAVYTEESEKRELSQEIHIKLLVVKKE